MNDRTPLTMTNIKATHILTALNPASRYALPHDCIWKAILALKIFDQGTIEIWLKQQQHIGIDLRNIKSYLKRLLLAEYIAIRSTRMMSGHTNATYLLIKNNCIYAPKRAGC